MAERIHLSSVASLRGTIWYTLILNDPVSFYVEVYNDSPNAFVKDRSKRILPTELHQYWVNDTPLITLVEQKLEEMAEASHLKSLIDRKKTPPRISP